MIKDSKTMNSKYDHSGKWNLCPSSPPKKYWPCPKGMLFTVTNIVLVTRHTLEISLGSLNIVFHYSSLFLCIIQDGGSVQSSYPMLPYSARLVHCFETLAIYLLTCQFSSATLAPYSLRVLPLRIATFPSITQEFSFLKISFFFFLCAVALCKALIPPTHFSFLLPFLTNFLKE